jgi:UDP-N-acetylglucosamine 2-epimerase (non-hydrolysing)
LVREGISAEKIAFVGNVMIDTVLQLSSRARLPEIPDLKGPFALLTLHRPSNVDCPTTLQRLLNTIRDLSVQIPIVFPIHPRTRQRISGLGVDIADFPGVYELPPIGYLECIALQREACLVMTDSGGLQEESTALGTPCLTIRENTERPTTVSEGTNTLVGTDTNLLKQEFNRVLAGRGKTGRIPEFWDGKASERIVARVLSDEMRFDIPHQHRSAA